MENYFSQDMSIAGLNNEKESRMIRMKCHVTISSCDISPLMSSLVRVSGRGRTWPDRRGEMTHQKADWKIWSTELRKLPLVPSRSAIQTPDHVTCRE